MEVNLDELVMMDNGARASEREVLFSNSSFDARSSRTRPVLDLDLRCSPPSYPLVPAAEASRKVKRRLAFLTLPSSLFPQSGSREGAGAFCQ